ncbi:MAG TPA: acylphosphatase [bacterium (Candidatus Stahlbacteria)]|nr:acylphosphatase [Candidatus Stahlbacteria bacterium]
MLKRVHIFVSGMVQGVFFRANTRDKANSLGINGWVRNLPDGRVEVVAEGEEEKLKELISWCYHGVPYARVDNVEVKWEEYKGEFETFSIRYW